MFLEFINKTEIGLTKSIKNSNRIAQYHISLPKSKTGQPVHPKYPILTDSSTIYKGTAI